MKTGMELPLGPITGHLKDHKEIYELMVRAFPENELISLSFWRLLALRKGTHYMMGKN